MLLNSSHLVSRVSAVGFLVIALLSPILVGVIIRLLRWRTNMPARSVHEYSVYMNRHKKSLVCPRCKISPHLSMAQAPIQIWGL